jgi:hypothetical protein
MHHHVHHQAPTFREQADDYPFVVSQLDDETRIIECPHGLQWIVQHRSGERYGRARWRSMAFCATKRGLRRYVPESAIEDFPEAFPRKAVKVQQESAAEAGQGGTYVDGVYVPAKAQEALRPTSGRFRPEWTALSTHAAETRRLAQERRAA